MKKKPSPAERAHHPYSPSTLGMLEACPCYKGRDSVHARTIAGTIAHGAAESGRDDNRLSDEDAVAVAEALDFVESRKRLMQAQANAHREANGGPEKKYRVVEMKESYLPVDDLEFPDGVESTTAGYIDVCLLSHDKKYAELVDHKFGSWKVEDAKTNLQGLAYALGLFKAIPSLERVRVFFKQPLIQSISEAEITRADIPAIYLRIQTVVARAREARAVGDFSAAKPQTPVCNFCANIGKCPAVCEFACQVAKKFHPLGVPDNIAPTMVLGQADTALCLQLASIVAIWSDSFKKQVNDRVLRGEAPVPPGYVLTTRQDREIADLVLFQTVSERYMRPAEYLGCCSPTFGKVEAIIKDRAERGQKSAAVKEFGEALLKAKAVKLGEVYAFLKVAPNKADE